MQGKKELIRRMALFAALAMAVGIAGVVITYVNMQERRARRAAREQQERAAAVESARAHLAEVGQRITAAPVNPAIVAEVEAAYFADSRERRRFIWGTDTQSGFLFGIPREAFARLNRLWDDHRDLLQGEGGFVDRQDFLRQLVHMSEEVAVALLDEEEQETRAVRETLRSRSDLRGWTSLSTPLRAEDGSALGSLYLQLGTPPGRGGGGGLEGVVAAFGATAGISFAFLWFLLPTWVYVDARERGMPRAALWSFLVLISLILGLVVYLIARPEQSGPLQCPACRREVNGGAFCPHCGHDLSRAFCSACRYPLKPDWSFCPSCRTEIGRGEGADAGALVSEGG